MDKKELLTERDTTTSKETNVPLMLTYNWSLPNLSRVVGKLWKFLSINKVEVFENEPVTVFRRNKNLKELFGSNKIEYNKVKKCRCSAGSVNNRKLSCKQVISPSNFQSHQTNKSYAIVHEVNCSSAYFIYLMECTLCQKKQYVGKSETSFNIRRNNHCKDVKKLEAILT